MRAGIFERESFLVYRFAFDVDGFVRGGRANVFAAAAPYADLRVGVGNGQSVAVGDHAHRLCGTVFGASSTTGAVGMDDAEILDEDHPPYLGAVFFFDAQGEDRSVGAHVRADGAVVVAEALVEVHHRLHHPGEAVFEQRRFEYSRRAFADAQVASGAVLPQMLVSQGAGRADGHLPGMSAPVAQAEAFLLAVSLCHQGRDGERSRQRGGQKFPAGGIFRGSFRGGSLRWKYRRFLGSRERERILPAGIQAVEAVHAAAVVDALVPAVDARGFAPGGAHPAVGAFRRVDPDFPPGKTTDQP